VRLAATVAARARVVEREERKTHLAGGCHEENCQNFSSDRYKRKTSPIKVFYLQYIICIKKKNNNIF
jgi:hypothetical protein